MIPISRVKVTAAERRRVVKVLRSGQLAQGKEVRELEEAFAKLSGVKHAIAVNNGTTSLVASLQALGVKAGDEVITTPFTFIATLNAILEVGATVRFADIRADDFNIDVASIEPLINERTRVIMPVHLYGHMADMASLISIAKKHDLRVIEDAAQSHGARQGQLTAGSFDIGSFSLYATKNITSGEGGVITTNDDQVADYIRVLRNQGMRQRYQYEMAGHNYRLTDLQAALVIPQIKRYPRVITKRTRNATYLQNKLTQIPGLITPKAEPERLHVWHQFTLRITKDCSFTREELANRLEEDGIGYGLYYPKLVTDYPTYATRPDVVRGTTPVAEMIAQEVISIPVHQHLRKRELKSIVASIRELHRAKKSSPNE